MSRKDGLTLHTAGGPADAPESAEAVLFEIETALRNFELSIHEAMGRYTRGMASKEVNTEILSMLNDTTEDTIAYATDYLKEMLSE